VKPQISFYAVHARNEVQPKTLQVGL